MKLIHSLLASLSKLEKQSELNELNEFTDEACLWASRMKEWNELKEANTTIDLTTDPM